MTFFQWMPQKHLWLREIMGGRVLSMAFSEYGIKFSDGKLTALIGVRFDNLSAAWGNRRRMKSDWLSPSSSSYSEFRHWRMRHLRRKQHSATQICVTCLFRCLRNGQTAKIPSFRTHSSSYPSTTSHKSVILPRKFVNKRKDFIILNSLILIAEIELARKHPIPGALPAGEVTLEEQHYRHVSSNS